MDVESGVFLPSGGGTVRVQEERRSALVATSSSAPRRTVTVNEVVTWKMGKEGVGGGGGGVTGSPRGRVLIINR